jgi:YidC/Oxa1 family membrane protein insertase
VRLLADVPVIQPLIDFFEAILKFFHDTIGLPWGWAIIALTIIVRACLLPLTFKQFHSMQRLAHLQPEMKKIQEKFKNDKERMNQEMMRFYRENKVNPFGSCLPLLLQLPVFIALFQLLRSDEFADKVAAAPPVGWFFINDLTEKATGPDLVILILLYVGSQLGSSLVMMATADRTQRTIFLLLPIMFVPVIVNFPTGLILYWITTNFWTFGQQVVVRKVAPPPQLAPIAGGEEGQKRPKKPPPPPRKKKRRRR